MPLPSQASAGPRPVWIINGPNLNLLGVREPEIYGGQTLADIEADCRRHAAGLGLALDFRQSNHEGVLVDWLHEARDQACAVVLNAAGYTHTSIALHDAIKSVSIPVIEVHISNPAAREAFRHVSMIAPVAKGSISGFGSNGYLLALTAVAMLMGGAAP